MSGYPVRQPAMKPRMAKGKKPAQPKASPKGQASGFSKSPAKGGMPPGIAKKVAAGGTLPPGIAKMQAVGNRTSVMPPPTLIGGSKVSPTKTAPPIMPDQRGVKTTAFVDKVPKTGRAGR